MRRDAGDLALDYALRTHFAKREADLTWRVLMKWRASRCSTPPPVETRSHLRSPWSARLLATAALIGLMVAGHALFRLRGDPSIAADGPVAVVVDGSWQPVVGSRFSIPATVFSDHGLRELRICGHVLRVPRAALFRVELREEDLLVELRAGEVLVETTGRGRLALHTPAGTALLSPAARARFSVGPDYLVSDAMTFPDLARAVHLSSTPLVLYLTATLMDGSAMFGSGDARQPWHRGEELAAVWRQVPGAEPEVLGSVQDPDQGADPMAVLLRLVGEWTVTGPVFDSITGKSLQGSGTETCSVGPGGRWLIIDTEMSSAAVSVSAHMVLGWEPRARRYVGSMVDSFGGAIQLMDGVLSTDGSTLLLTPRAAGGEEPRFRLALRLAGLDERISEMQTLDEEGNWQAYRTLRYRRAM